MNFDVNTLSALMQMMGSQKPRESEDSYRAGNGIDNSYNNSAGSQRPSQSVFAMQNGLGQRIDLNPKPEKKSQSTSNPMSAIMDMMGGKGGSGGTDVMSSLMPMFMNMMSKPAQVANSGNTSSTKKEDSFEEKLKKAMSDATENEHALKQDVKHEENNTNFNKQNMQNTQSNRTNSNITRDRYSPISFAGYTLICSLNKLYMAKKYELS